MRDRDFSRPPTRYKKSYGNNRSNTSRRPAHISSSRSGIVYGGDFLGDVNLSSNSSERKRSFGGFSGNRRSFGSRGDFRNRNSRGFSSGRSGRRSSRKPKSEQIDISRFIKKAKIKTSEVQYKPKHNFSDFNLNPELLRNITSKNYKDLTPIQDQGIPVVQGGKDFVGVANTGTGKTVAFLVPLIDKVFKSKNERVLIVAPTRELALQINNELWALTKGMRIFSALCIGGAAMSTQIWSLKRNPNFVIGTPGRLKDLIEREVLNLSRFANVVLDEADRMLDMGFIEDIKTILNEMSEKKQMLLFSATMEGKVQDIIKGFANNPITISVKTGETTDNVDQDVVRFRNRNEKFDKLVEILSGKDLEKVLIFVSTKFGTERVKDELREKGFAAASIHGDKSQARRQKALLDFRQDKIQILVATDVAARGLDIKGVTHVINYDQPNNYEDYVHRIGRTGRADATGVALTFVEENSRY
jgi:ATP-dependent RNA helicase RhlE